MPNQPSFARRFTPVIDLEQIQLGDTCSASVVSGIYPRRGMQVMEFTPRMRTAGHFVNHAFSNKALNPAYP